MYLNIWRDQIIQEFLLKKLKALDTINIYEYKIFYMQ